MADVNEQMGPSRRKKDANKGYIEFTKLTLGDGLTFIHQKPDGTKISSQQLVPWGDIAEDEVVLSLDGVGTDVELATVSGDIISYVDTRDGVVAAAASALAVTASGDIISYVDIQDDSHQAAATAAGIAYTVGRLSGYTGTITVSGTGAVLTVVSGLIITVA